jgi:hypothetical protein
MKLQQDGDLEVGPGETVTVEIEANETAFLAHTGPIQLGQWISVDHAAAREVRTFAVTSAFTANFFFVMGFDFSPVEPGKPISASAHYIVRISGDGPTGFVRRRVVKPTPILPGIRVFSFEVGQG